MVDDRAFIKKPAEERISDPCKATDPHSDSITTEEKDWTPPSKEGKHASFRLFMGATPRFLPKAFFKNRSYKDKGTRDHIFDEPQWDYPTSIYNISYPEMEVKLTLEFKNG